MAVQLQQQVSADPPLENFHEPEALATKLSLSTTKVRRMFEREPGVLKIGTPSKRLGRKLKRRYYTLRIPDSVVRRVVARLTVKAA